MIFRKASRRALAGLLFPFALMAGTACASDKPVKGDTATPASETAENRKDEGKPLLPVIGEGAYGLPLHPIKAADLAERYPFLLKIFPGSLGSLESLKRSDETSPFFFSTFRDEKNKREFLVLARTGENDCAVLGCTLEFYARDDGKEFSSILTGVVAPPKVGVEKKDGEVFFILSGPKGLTKWGFNKTSTELVARGPYHPSQKPGARP